MKTNIKNKNLNFLSINSLNIGAYLITPILLGVFIGYNLDRGYCQNEVHMNDDNRY